MNKVVTKEWHTQASQPPAQRSQVQGAAAGGGGGGVEPAANASGRICYWYSVWPQGLIDICARVPGYSRLLSCSPGPAACIFGTYPWALRRPKHYLLRTRNQDPACPRGLVRHRSPGLLLGRNTSSMRARPKLPLPSCCNKHAQRAAACASNCTSTTYCPAYLGQRAFPHSSTKCRPRVASWLDCQDNHRPYCAKDQSQ